MQQSLARPTAGARERGTAAPLRPASAGLRRARAAARPAVVARASNNNNDNKGVGHTLAVIAEGMKDIWSFESWAPRGARAFRLREVPNEVSSKTAQEEAAKEAVLVEAAMRGELTLQEGDENYEAMQTLSRFRQTIDEATKRMDQDDGSVLTGSSLAEMCYSKYNRYHDMSIKHVTMNKGKTARWVALNIYVGHLGQRTFPYNEEEYIEKLDSVATMLNAWDQVDYVKAFFDEPPIPRRGLPSRPRVDTAVSLRLNASPNWDDALADEFFSY